MRRIEHRTRPRIPVTGPDGEITGYAGNVIELSQGYSYQPADQPDSTDERIAAALERIADSLESLADVHGSQPGTDAYRAVPAGNLPWRSPHPLYDRNGLRASLAGYGRPPWAPGGAS